MLVLAAAGGPSSYDPVAVNAALTDAFVSLIYNGLLGFRNGTARFPDPADATVVPDLAAAAPEQPDERGYVFKLRPDVRWQQPAPLGGRPFTAEDVAWHYRRAMSDQRSVLRPAFRFIASVEAPDATTVSFRLTEPYAPFLTTIAGGFARFIVPREAIEAARPGSVLAGTGPFMPASAQPNRRAMFQRNPDYFKRDAAGAQLPYVSGVEWLELSDPAARMQAYQARQAQLTWTLGPDEAAQLRASNPNDYDFLESPGVSNDLFMPLDRPPFDDVRVRQALSLALDRADLLQHVAAGRGVPDLPIPVFLRGAVQGLTDLGSAARFYARDLQAAKQLLAAAGHADGLQTTFSFTGQYGAPFVRAAQSMQGYLRDAGIDATPRQLDYPTWTGTVFRGKFDGLAYAPRSVMPDADGYLGEVYLPGGLYVQAAPNDQQLAALILRERRTLDPAACGALLSELQRYLAEQQYRVCDVAVTRTFAWQRAVQNYRGTLWPTYGNLESAWVMK